MNNKIIEKIPTWAMCYLVNGDASGLTDEEIALTDEYCKRNYVSVVCPINDSVEEEMQPYFTLYPAFGPACDVIDCIIITQS
jgi:hypothetical protein